MSPNNNKRSDNPSMNLYTVHTIFADEIPHYIFVNIFAFIKGR